MLREFKEQKPAVISYVVPGVLPISSLRNAITELKARLVTQRSIIKFPSEKLGEAYEWWDTFLRDELERQQHMCAICRGIREELATIVVHQSKSKVTETRVANAQKLARRDKLLANLGTHDCSDRKAGRLNVDVLKSAILSAFTASKRHPLNNPNNDAMGKEKDNAQSDSDSCDELKHAICREHDQEPHTQLHIEIGLMPFGKVCLP